MGRGAQYGSLKSDKEIKTEILLKDVSKLLRQYVITTDPKYLEMMTKSLGLERIRWSKNDEIYWDLWVNILKKLSAEKSYIYLLRIDLHHSLKDNSSIYIISKIRMVKTSKPAVVILISLVFASVLAREGNLQA